MSSLKVLWAIDAFENHDHVLPQQAEFLGQLTHWTGRSLQIFPATILSPEQLGIPGELPEEAAEAYVPSARKALDVALQSLRSKKPAGVEASAVVISPSTTLRGTVKRLLRHAEQVQADLVLVGSHGRRGLQRAMLGSFAEELLLQSHLPIIVHRFSETSLQGATGASQTGPRILVATDFSNDSRAVFQRILSEFAGSRAEVRLLHASPRPLTAVLESGVYLVSGGWVPAEAYLQKTDEQLHATLREWAQAGKAHQLEVKTILDTQSISVPESILKAARDFHCDFIALAAESGRLGSVLLGSIARQIVRNAPCPVWVHRLPAEK